MASGWFPIRPRLPHRLEVPGRRPVQLLPARVEKPWGRELWYTGVEPHGVARVACAGKVVELPDLLRDSADWGPRHASGLPLLKALEPIADPVRGQLYLEVHESKWEAYVVTDVAAVAWPGGKAVMRLGVNRALFSAYISATHFRQDFERKLRCCEALRQEVDESITHGVPPTADLRRREREAYAAVDSFCGKRSLQPGDVVSIPPGVPHGLPHGVRVLEYQTQHYERLVLSSSQRLWTQADWDIGSGVAALDLASPDQPPPRTLARGQGHHLEQILEAPCFRVFRLEIWPPSSFSMNPQSSYGLLSVLAGRGEAAGVSLRPGQNWMLPVSPGGISIESRGSEVLSLLLVQPHIEAP